MNYLGPAAALSHLGVPGLLLSLREARIAMAANAIRNPVHKKLTYHYGYGSGAPLVLTVDDLKAMDVDLDVFRVPAIRKARAALVDEYVATPAPERISLIRTRLSGECLALANGSLASCRAHVYGSLTYTGPVIGCEFAGTVWFEDDWDFDTKILETIKGTSGRSAMGELETVAAALGLPGDPFKVSTPIVPCRQNQLQKGATLRLNATG